LIRQRSDRLTSKDILVNFQENSKTCKQIQWVALITRGRRCRRGLCSAFVLHRKTADAPVLDSSFTGAPTILPAADVPFPNLQFTFYLPKLVGLLQVSQPGRLCTLGQASYRLSEDQVDVTRGKFRSAIFSPSCRPYRLVYL
jgi:hypothetical protein